MDPTVLLGLSLMVLGAVIGCLGERVEGVTRQRPLPPSLPSPGAPSVGLPGPTATPSTVSGEAPARPVPPEGPTPAAMKET